LNCSSTHPTTETKKGQATTTFDWWLIHPTTLNHNQQQSWIDHQYNYQMKTTIKQQQRLIGDQYNQQRWTIATNEQPETKLDWSSIKPRILNHNQQQCCIDHLYN